jgi:hypothetical protein
MLERHIVEELIKAIPEEWTLRTGWLSAPHGLIAAGEALNYTEFLFGSQIDQMIRGIDNCPPDIVGILIKKKMPAEVKFGNSSCLGRCEVLSPTERVAIACHFIQAGYRGRLKFAWGGDDDNPAPFVCEIFLPKTQRHPADITVEIDNSRLDTARALPILNFCRDVLQLIEIRPEKE